MLRCLQASEPPEIPPKALAKLQITSADPPMFAPVKAPNYGSLVFRLQVVASQAQQLHSASKLQSLAHILCVLGSVLR